jgi:predicted transcriptional regulator
MDAHTAPRPSRADADPTSVLDALNDEDCRAILAACAKDPRTVRELAEEHSIPLSSAYRKVETLAENGLLEEHTRPRKRGKHPSEYTRAVGGVTARVDDDGGVELSFLD